MLYPGLPSHPGHDIARRQMTGAGGRGYGGMVTIEVKGGVRAAVRVCDALRVAVNAMSLGGVETLVSIPVYSSHIRMSARELRRAGRHSRNDPYFGRRRGNRRSQARFRAGFGRPGTPDEQDFLIITRVLVKILLCCIPLLIRWRLYSWPHPCIAPPVL